MIDQVTREKLDKYFTISQEAYDMAVKAPVADGKQEERDDILDMAQRYISDAHHFDSQENMVLAFAALNYAHGWLDAGARLKFFIVKDSRLFTVDEE